MKLLERWVKVNNIPIKHMHTSGHAKLCDLEKLCTALSTNVMVPFHSFHTEQFDRYFPNVKVLLDTEALEV